MGTLERRARDDMLTAGLGNYLESSSMFDFNKTTNKFDDLASFSNTRRHLQYAEYAFSANYFRLLASDINDPYLRAAFLGDFLQIKYSPFSNDVIGLFRVH
jgi:hypothetical protein